SAEYHLADELRRIGIEIQHLAAQLQEHWIVAAAHHAHERKLAIDDVAEGGGVRAAYATFAAIVLGEMFGSGGLEPELLPRVQHGADLADALALDVEPSVDDKPGDALLRAETLDAHLVAIDREARRGDRLLERRARHHLEALAAWDLLTDGDGRRKLH